jgi:hypothetical protein
MSWLGRKILEERGSPTQVLTRAYAALEKGPRVRPGREADPRCVELAERAAVAHTGTRTQTARRYFLPSTSSSSRPRAPRSRG